MSADRRKKILIAFAGLAVVLVAVITVVSPSFRSEDASGAIGAVQKHRAPQIAKTDVILGNENVRQQQKFLYTDFLADAASLRNAAADVAMAAQAPESISRFAAVRSSLEVKSADLSARAVRAMSEELAGMKAILENADNEFALEAKKNMLAEIESLTASVDNKQLQSEDIQALSSQVAAVEAQLEASPCCAGSNAAVEMRKLKSVNEAIENRNADGAQAALASFQSDLAAAQANLGAKMQAQTAYIESMAKEMKSLESASQALSALEAKSAQAENRASTANQAAEISNKLVENAKSFEMKALANMKAQSAAAAESAATLAKMSAMLISMSAAAENRSMTGLKTELQSAAHAAENRSAEAQARAVVDVRSQFEAISDQLGSFEQLNAKLAQASVESHTNAASRAAENRQTVDAFAVYLSNLSQAVENRSLASALANSPDFATEAHALIGRTAALQSRER